MLAFAKQNFGFRPTSKGNSEFIRSGFAEVAIFFEHSAQLAHRQRRMVRIQVQQQVAVGTYDGQVFQGGAAGSVQRGQLFSVMDLKHPNSPAAKHLGVVAPAHAANPLSSAQRFLSQPPAAAGGKYYDFLFEPLDVRLCGKLLWTLPFD